MTSKKQRNLSHDPAVFFSHRASGIDQSTVIMARASHDSFTESAAHHGDGRHAASLRSYLELPFVYKRLIIGCLAAAILLGWAALLVWPRKYESEAKLMLRVGRESVSLDPTATTSQTLMLQKTQEEEVVSALEMLGSRQIAEGVVDELGESSILNGSLPSEGGEPAGPTVVDRVKGLVSGAIDLVATTSGLRDEISNHEVAVRRVQGAVEIKAQKKSNVISVQASAKTPEMAQALVQQTCDTYLKQHLLNSQTAGSHDFFVQQVDAAEAHLNALTDRKSDYMKKRGIVSVEANRALLQEQLATCERELLMATGSLEQVNAEMADLRRKIADTDEEIIAERKEGSDSTWSGMRQQVYELELQEKSLAAKYTPQHRRLIETREQLDGARMIMAKLRSERVDHSMTPNPMKRRMEDDLQRSQTQVVGLQSVVLEKERQRVQLAQQVRELHDWEIELTQMDRDIESSAASLKKLVEKLEEARVIEELRNQQISNVSVFQPATFVERPASPNKRILAAGFVMLGLCSGVGLAFLREIGSDTMRTAEHVESSLRYPVLTKIPHQPRLELGNSIRRLDDAGDIRTRCRSIIGDLMLSRAQPIGEPPRGRSLGVIGIEPGCGASTLAAALAMVSSDDCGLKTILIDADGRTRSVSKAFGLQNAPGLLELSAGDAAVEQCVQQLSDSKLSLLPYASPSANASDADSVDRHDPRQTIEAFQQANDLVIIDFPPASLPDQALSLAQTLDYVVVVVESEKTKVAQAQRFLNRFAGSDTEVIGIVLNKTRNYAPAMFSGA
ncbi:GumC family protein [Rosistilla oblonga]|uniref:GumC family protein n=1 Tax=Rosistilla oblonga TaxID=2527990 RepID=UPI003A96C97F